MMTVLVTGRGFGRASLFLEERKKLADKDLGKTQLRAMNDRSKHMCTGLEIE